MKPADDGQSIAVVINGSAGCGHDKHKLDEIASLFHARGRRVKATLADAGEMDDAVKKALREGATTIVVGGGDGTLSAIAGLLVGTGVALGILPMGSRNHFAKDLGIPLDLAAAVDTVLAGRAVNVDTGEVNGRVFINNSSIGIYPDIVCLRERQRERFGTRKWLAFAAATWTVLHRSARLQLRITAADRELARHTPFAFVGNNEYRHAGFEMGSRTSVQRGVLNVYTTRRKGFLGILRITLKGLAGRLDRGSDYDSLTAADVVVHTRRSRLRVANDGEVEWMQSPLRYRSRAGALRVLIDAPSQVRNP